MPSQIQRTRDQHTVPQWHLRDFADASGQVWCYKQNRPVKRSRPKGECWERDFYEFEVNGRKTNNEYENWLGRIENDAAARLRILLGHSRLGQWDATVWASYVASLFVRTGKVRAQISSAMIRGSGARPEAPPISEIYSTSC